MYKMMEEHAKVTLDVTSQEIEQIKREFNFNLESKNLAVSAEIKNFHEQGKYDPNISQRRNCENFVLKPDPIMALDRVIGVHPRYNPG